MNTHFRPLFRRTSVRLAAFAVLAPALSLGAVVALPSTPALAYSCPLNDLCTWQNSGYSGTQWNFGGQGDFWYFVGGSANDQISSYVNRSQEDAYIAKNCPADSQWTWFGNGASNSNLAYAKWPNGTSINDSISAYAINSYNDVDIDFPAHGDRTHGGC